MIEWLMRLGDAVVPIIMTLCGSLVAIVAIAASAWQKQRRYEAELAFKRDLLERGLPPAEIERLLGAGGPGESPRSSALYRSLDSQAQ